MTSMMKAAVLDAKDAPFRVVDVPRPVAGPGEVLVRIAASGVNPLDTKIRAGVAPHARHPLPAILGLDLAGTVSAVGEGVTRFRPGDAVYGMTGGVGGIPGSLAKYAAVDADLLARKPDALSMREAAALPLIAITAWEGLVDRMVIAAGQTVLVLGGAGGVGHIAVQIAKALGTTVFATASAGDRTVIEGYGAVFIDRDEPIAEAVSRLTGSRGFDRVFDTAGGKALDDAFVAVARFGHTTSALGRDSYVLAPLSLKGASYSGIATLVPLLSGEGRAHHGEILERVAKLADAGTLRPRLDFRRFKLETAGEAHDAFTGRTAKGKIVVEIG